MFPAEAYSSLQVGGWMIGDDRYIKDVSANHFNHGTGDPQSPVGVVQRLLTIATPIIEAGYELEAVLRLLFITGWPDSRYPPRTSYSADATIDSVGWTIQQI